ncbi:BrnT family toxin [candidate division NPL-UPA2 bacterium]|nr:BrnT family toxin [candidate division NPL-UPA2 bacterium]
MKVLSEFIGFNWDERNKDKNWVKHKVSDLECEEVFFNIPLTVFPDKTHSDTENRYYVLGRTNRGRFLFVVFTRRGDKIRVISAREMTKKERRYYHEAEEKYS